MLEITNNQRVLVIPDIHNCFRGLKQAIQRANITSQDKLIFLGDYFDGWSEAKEVFLYLLELSKTNECVFIRGNHDQWVYEYLTGNNESSRSWLHHGGLATHNSLYKWFDNDTTALDLVINWLSNLKPYYIDNANRLYVHAGFESDKGVEHEKYQDTLWWTRDLVYKSFEASPTHLNKLKIYKEVYIGHTPTRTITGAPCSVPLNIENLYALDTGAAFDGKVTIMDVDTKEIWQSDFVKELYPFEKGRN